MLSCSGSPDIFLGEMSGRKHVVSLKGHVANAHPELSARGSTTYRFVCEYWMLVLPSDLIYGW